MPPKRTFQSVIEEKALDLSRLPADTLQINLGKRCNQACHHCHVEAGPKRTEVMEPGTIDRLLNLLATSPTIKTVDLTGGAPELNPNFRKLVSAVRGKGIKVIDRCNLTVLFEKGQEDTHRFLAEEGVAIVASLPCYSQSNVDKQRGKGVFGKSIEALQMLNSLGYAKSESGLELDLVYNPIGPFLPPPESNLEEEYRKKLRADFGIEFNHLFTITNMPIKRFLSDLNRTGKLEEYMTLLANSFNPSAAKRVMCRSLISVGWDGQVYDCDFNQMLELPIGEKRTTIWEIETFSDLATRKIFFKDHCFGCTAGAGSSCTGATLVTGELE